MTELDDVVLAAVRILTRLGEKLTTPADAAHDLTTAAAKGGLRARLIEHEEAYDGSVHHDVIVRGPGRPTVSLSVSCGPGLPWPLRGVARPREFDLVEVNGETTTVGEAIACLDGMFDDVRLLRSVVDASLVGQAIDELGLEVSAEELQGATDAYRRAHRLYSKEATDAWLRERNLTPPLLALMVERYLKVGKLRRHVVGAEVDRWFTRHRADLDMIVVAWAAAGPEVAPRLRADPLGAVAAAWRDGGAGGLDQWLAGDLPAGLAMLRTAAVGEVAAAEHDGAEVAAIVVDRRAAVRDASTLDAVERRLFDEWLAERRADARVTWFWGDHRRTRRVVDGSR